MFTGPKCPPLFATFLFTLQPNWIRGGCLFLFGVVRSDTSVLFVEKTKETLCAFVHHSSPLLVRYVVAVVPKRSKGSFSVSTFGKVTMPTQSPPLAFGFECVIGDARGGFVVCYFLGPPGFDLICSCHFSAPGGVLRHMRSADTRALSSSDHRLAKPTGRIRRYRQANIAFRSPTS
jgi:hypothetical protein